MKISIGIILLYIIAVVVSSYIMRAIWNKGFKCTEHEETWGSALKSFAIGYLIAGLFFGSIVLIFHFFFS